MRFPLFLLISILFFLFFFLFRFFFPSSLIAIYLIPLPFASTYFLYNYSFFPLNLTPFLPLFFSNPYRLHLLFPSSFSLLLLSLFQSISSSFSLFFFLLCHSYFFISISLIYFLSLTFSRSKYYLQFFIFCSYSFFFLSLYHLHYLFLYFFFNPAFSLNEIN